MRLVRFVSTVAATISMIAAAASASPVNMGPVSLLAGHTTSGSVFDVAGGDARMYNPRSMVYDSQGNLYVTERGATGHPARISRVDRSTGIYTNVITLTSYGTDLMFDPTDEDKLLVIQNNVGIHKYTLSDSTSTQWSPTSGMAIDYDAASNTFFILDAGYNLATIPATGGAATTIRPNLGSRDIVVKQNSGRLFATDYAAFNGWGILEVPLDASSVTSVAGGWGGASVDGVGAAAGFGFFIEKIAITQGGEYVFVADSPHVRRMHTLTYVVDTVFNTAGATVATGNPYPATFADSLSATLNQVFCVAVFGNADLVAAGGLHAAMQATAPTPIPDPSTLPPNFVTAYRAQLRILGDLFLQLWQTPSDQLALRTAVQNDIAAKLNVVNTYVFIANFYLGSLVVDVAIDAAAGVSPDAISTAFNEIAADPQQQLPATAALYATVSNDPLTTAELSNVVTAAPGVVTPVAPACACGAEKMTAVYTSDAIPDATAESEVNISLDTDTWEVVFQIRNVKAISNGHVIAAAVDTQATAAAAFTPLVSAFDANSLWQPLECGLGGIDTPVSTLNVDAQWSNTACRTTYEMRYSLVDPAKQDTQHCSLSDDGEGTIKVNCSVVLSSVRAFDSTEPEAFLAQEAAFAAEITLGSQLNNEVENLLHATLAKCSVKNGPLYVVDCRVPGQWNFQNTFQIVQEPVGWINAASCAATQTTTATFIRCDIENDAPIANIEVARANLTATPDETTTNPMTFDIEFIIPRRITTSTSASLASFIQGISMVDGKFYYGTADKATLHIDVFDSSRLTMTALELFNSATPSKEVQDLFPDRADARFQTAINANPTRFVVDFYPAALRENSRFYRFGPHGLNISFTFAAARRVTGGGTGARQEGDGWAVVNGLNVQGDEDVEGSGAGATFAIGSSSNAAMVAGILIASVVAIVGVVGAVTMRVARKSATPEQPAAGKAVAEL